VVNLHILGAQKSGTTALASFLSEHPDIFLLKDKEAHVFDDPAFLQSKQKMQFAKSKYKRLSTDYQNQAYLMDATPITLYNPIFVAHCYRYNPNSKFIIVFRDPTERAISHYNMSLSRHQENRNMLLAFLLERIRLSRHQGNWRFDSPLRTQSYLSRGLYSKQLASLFKIVPASQVLVLYSRDLREQHQEVMQEIFYFLSVGEHHIEAKDVFRGEPAPNTLVNRLARLYASLYFKIKRENRKRWQRLIQNAHSLNDA
jgi:hypothetical protein